MKKSIFLILVLSFLFSCGSEQVEVERIIEEGVEVVINHHEPYKLKNEPVNLVLTEHMKIDLERPDLAEIGLADSDGFDVDSKGNIYIKTGEPKEHFIYKFNNKGDFLASFIQKGQGPGEVQYIVQGGIDNKDNMIISDQVNQAAYIFTNDGNLVKKVPNPQEVFFMYPLENGNFLAYRHLESEWKPSDDYLFSSISFYNAELKEIKKLDLYKESIRKGNNALNPNSLFLWKKSKENIYIGNENRGYEILKYNLEGDLLRKIRKDYTPVKIPDDLKKRAKERYAKSGRKFYINDYWPPYYSFFPDDEGRLFVMTYEEGNNPGEYIFDIFNPDGVFINRKSINIFAWAGVEICAIAKNKHLYCLREKESGFKELLVYEMRWEGKRQIL